MVANYWTWRSFFDLLAVIAYLKTFILLPFTFPLKKVWSFVTFHEIMMVQKCPPPPSTSSKILPAQSRWPGAHLPPVNYQNLTQCFSGLLALECITYPAG